MIRRRRGAAAAALATLLVGLGTVGTEPHGLGPIGIDGASAASSASAAAPTTTAPGDELDVTIDSLSPTHLRKGEPVRITGRITNTTDHAWTDLRVYLVIPRQPITSRDELDSALADPSAGSRGERLVDLEALTRAGDLAPGDTTTYRLRVPYNLLGVSGASGVYPIGAQVLATDERGTRSNEAVGRAFTLMPSVPGNQGQQTDTALVWPFMAHIQRRTDGTYSGKEQLVEAVSSGGRLRRMLDLARSGGNTPSTVLIDPTLLDALHDIATDTYGPPVLTEGGGDAQQTTPTPGDSSGDGGDTEPTPSPEAQPAKDFLDDLVAFASNRPVWTMAYGRPDVRALTRKGIRNRGNEVAAAARSATKATLDEFGLNARQVFWPRNGITARGTLERARSHGNRASIVSPEVVDGWDPSAGAFQSIDVDDRSVPTLVDDPALMDSGTEGDSALEVRQRLVSETALAALGGGGQDPTAVVVDPGWDPGTEWDKSDFYAAFDAPWVDPVNAERRLGSSGLPSASIQLPADQRPSPITRKQVRAASATVRHARTLASVVQGDGGAPTYYAEVAGLSASQDWRSTRRAGITYARAHRNRVHDQIGQISVKATEFVTLSGQSGNFPLTITNGLDVPVTVGVQMRSDNPSMTVDNVEPAEIGPGQSRTVTVDADVGRVSTSSVTARLVTPGGETFGEPTEFKVRSSVVGVVIWIGMGVAGALVVAAVVRRLWRRSRGRESGVSSDATPMRGTAVSGTTSRSPGGPS